MKTTGHIFSFFPGGLKPKAGDSNSSFAPLSPCEEPCEVPEAAESISSGA